MNDDARATAPVTIDPKATAVMTYPWPLSRSGQISPSYLRSVGIVFGSVNATSAAATCTPMAPFETRTTQAESRKWRPIPAATTAATGTPSRISSATAKR